MKRYPETDEATVEIEVKEACLLSRRDFMKKTAYQAPTLVVMGTLASVKTATAASLCGEPPFEVPCEP